MPGAIVGSAIIGGVSSIIGGRKAAKGAKEGAEIGAAASDRATEAQLEMFYTGREDLMPFIQGGQRAFEELFGTTTYGLPEPDRADFKVGPAASGGLFGRVASRAVLAGAVDPTPGFYQTQAEADAAFEAANEKYQASATTTGGLVQQGPGEFVPEDQPGYKFGFEEFIRKPQGQAAAASGQRLGGQTLRDLTKYASDYASTGYDNFLNRYYASLDPYFKGAGIGQASAAGSAAAGVQTGRGVAQSIQAGGAYGAQGAIGQANAYNQGLAGVAGAGQNALQSYMDMKILDKIGVGGTNFLN